MEFASHPVAALLILLGVLVFGHELGHYLVGRWCGIAVEIFSIGFGPPIFRWRRGETEYRISLLPLGGFVKFYGSIPSEDVPEEVRGREFHSSAPYKRALTVAAGPVANLIIAVVAYGMTGHLGIPHQRSIVGQILPGSAAEKANLRPGDEIVAIEGQSIKTWSEMLEIVSESPGKELKISVSRNSDRIDKTVTPESHSVMPYPGAEKKTTGRIGIGLGLVPAVVVLDNPKSKLRMMGFPPLFTVEEVSYEGESRKIEFFADLVNAVNTVKTGGQAKFVSLSIEDAKNGEKKQLSLPAGEFANVSEFKNQHNLKDAQLVIKGHKSETWEDKIKPRDMVVGFQGQDIASVFQFREVLTDNKEKSVSIKLLNLDTNQFRTENIDLVGREVQTPAGKEVIFTFPAEFFGQPIAPEPYIEKYSNPFAALKYGVLETIEMSGFLVVKISELFTGEAPLASLGGPILIAKVASESAKRGWVTFLSMLALISVNLAMINLLPVPVFDGGQLIMVGIEAARRKPMSEAAIENFQKIGFVIIVVLMFLATYNDVKRVWISNL